jgi:hypothetical protein
MIKIGKIPPESGKLPGMKQFMQCKGKKCSFHCNGKLQGSLEQKVEVVKK